MRGGFAFGESKRMVRKYLNYIIFGFVVLVVVGLAVNHSRNMRQLVNDMANGSPEAQKAAAAKLITAEQFMDSITGETKETRIKVAGALEALATPDAVKQGVTMLKDADRSVGDRVVQVLQKIGAASPAHIKALVEGLKNGDANIRKGTIVALSDSKSGVGPKPGVSAEIVALMKADGNARSPGGDVLGSKLFTQDAAARAESVQLLIQQMEEKDEAVRGGAAEALGKVGDPAALDRLKTAMKSDTAQLRRIAIGSIALIADQRGEDVLTEAITNTDDDNEARAQAAAGLGKIATPSALDTLLKTLDDDDLKLRSAAVAALARAGRQTADTAANPEVVSRLNAALSDPRETVRMGAAQAFQVIGSKEANAALIAILKGDGSTELKSATARALGFEGNTEAITPLISVIGSDTGVVGEAARDSLARIGSGATDALTGLLAQGGTQAYAAAQALAQQGTAALSALQKSAQSTNPVTQRWAAVALGGLGVAEARPVLEKLGKSSDPDVAYVAQEQLRSLGH